MLDKADLVISQVPHESKRCSMGHLNDKEGVTFFSIVSKKSNFGVVCSSCLTIAQYMAKGIKNGVR